MNPRTLSRCALVASLILAGCTGSDEPAESEAPSVESSLPSDAEVDAMDAAAEEAAGEINEANADATLDELEAAIGAEKDGGE